MNVDGDGKNGGHNMMDREKNLLWSLQWIKAGETYRLIDSLNGGVNYLGHVH